MANLVKLPFVRQFLRYRKLLISICIRIVYFICWNLINNETTFNCTKINVSD